MGEAPAMRFEKEVRGFEVLSRSEDQIVSQVVINGVFEDIGIHAIPDSLGRVLRSGPSSGRVLRCAGGGRFVCQELDDTHLVTDMPVGGIRPFVAYLLLRFRAPIFNIVIGKNRPA